MQIAIPLFDRVTALDAIGPYEVLQRLPDTTVTFVGDRTGTIRTDNGMLGLSIDATFDELLTPDVIVVPGGVGTRAFTDGADHRILSWVRRAPTPCRCSTPEASPRPGPR